MPANAADLRPACRGQCSSTSLPTSAPLAAAAAPTSSYYHTYHNNVAFLAAATAPPPPPPPRSSPQNPPWRPVGQTFSSFRWPRRGLSLTARRSWHTASCLMISLAAVFLVLGSTAAHDFKDREPPKATKSDKHFTELDLSCESYTDGVDWSLVKRQVKTWLLDPMGDHDFLGELLAIGRHQKYSDCYIGLCSLGYMSLLFADPQRRQQVMKSTLFGSVSLREQIPLSYWDTIASGWPIFGLLELVSTQLKNPLEGEEAEAAAVRLEDISPDGCCDRIQDRNDLEYLGILEDKLARGEAVPLSASFRYLAEAPSRCSWGKAVAYFALAEQILHAGQPGSQSRAKDLIVLGESQVDNCAVGRNITVREQMYSKWPYWSILRRVESGGDVRHYSQMLPPGGGYQAPPLAPFSAPRGGASGSSTSWSVGSPLLAAAASTSAPSPYSASASSAASSPSPPATVSATGTAVAALVSVHSECGGRDVHVAFAGDREHIEGFLAALNSAVSRTASPQRLCFHVFCLGSEEEFLRAALVCSFRGRLAQASASSFLLDGAIVHLQRFEREQVLTSYLLVDGGVTVETGNLNAPHNYIRFHLTQWLSPRVVPQIIYLDTDIIVLGDLCALHDHVLANRASHEVVAAVPRYHLPLAVYLKALSPQLPVWLPSTAPSFNAGVLVLNLEAWEEGNFTGKVDWWARKNSNRTLWRHGSQPPLLLLLYDKVKWLDETWNVDGLGHYKNHSPGALENAKILHWTGPLKPWVPNGLHQERWELFAVHCWKGAGNGLPT